MIHLLPISIFISASWNTSDTLWKGDSWKIFAHSKSVHLETHLCTLHFCTFFNLKCFIHIISINLPNTIMLLILFPFVVKWRWGFEWLTYLPKDAESRSRPLLHCYYFSIISCTIISWYWTSLVSSKNVRLIVQNAWCLIRSGDVPRIRQSGCPGPHYWHVICSHLPVFILTSVVPYSATHTVFFQ